MALSRDQVRKVARLARLELSDSEIDRMAEHLGSILGYVEQLAEVDTENVEPLAHCLPIENVFRPDRITESLPAAEALANAPRRAGDYYAVPAILD